MRASSRSVTSSVLFISITLVWRSQNVRPWPDAAEVAERRPEAEAGSRRERVPHLLGVAAQQPGRIAAEPRHGAGQVQPVGPAVADQSDADPPVFGRLQQREVFRLDGEDLPDGDLPWPRAPSRRRRPRRRSSRGRRGPDTSGSRAGGSTARPACRAAAGGRGRPGTPPGAAGPRPAACGSGRSRPGRRPAGRGDGPSAGSGGKRTRSAILQIRMASRPQQKGQIELSPHELGGCGRDERRGAIAELGDPPVDRGRCGAGGRVPADRDQLRDAPRHSPIRR